MNAARARSAINDVPATELRNAPFVRAYCTTVATRLGRRYFFDSEWSYQRGYRYNFRRTCPTLYLAADQLVASMEVGPRTREGLLVPHLQTAADPYLYVTVLVSGPFLDLTGRATRRRLGVTKRELTVPTAVWEAEMAEGRRASTHVIGSLASSSGRFGGVLYPPYPTRGLVRMPGKQNVAIFMDRNSPAMARPLHPSVRLHAVDEDRVLAALGLRLS